MQVRVDVKCMHTNFGGCALFNFRDIATFKNGQISMNYIVHVGQKIHASTEMHAVWLARVECHVHMTHYACFC